MSASLLSGCLWVVFSAFVAMLPMRWQFPPGIVLLLAAPCLLAWIARDNGLWIFAVGAFAFLSMFRNPLIHLVRKFRQKFDEVPS